jgi:hypothetical protein
MCQIAAIVVGKEHGHMQSGKNILASLDKFLIEWQAMECNIPALSWVIVSNTLACHKTQSVHFKNCMTPPADLQFELIDRFGHSVLRQGSGKNENQWAHKRAAFPKACAPAFGLALQTVIVAGVNSDCELIYDSQWTFLPISTMHIIVTQFWSPYHHNLLKLQPRLVLHQCFNCCQCPRGIVMRCLA